MKQRTIKKREHIEHAANFPLSYKARKVYVYSMIGIKVYAYNIGDYCFFTSKPKQERSKAYSLQYALWLIRYYNGVMDRR